jgi:transcriptional regulator with XRE-family HTH domain
MFLSENLKFLRKRKHRTQSEVADALGLKRPTLSGYENKISEPDLETLIKLASYFHVSVDSLIKENLQLMSEREIQIMESDSESRMTGKAMRVLVSTVNTENEDNIELVNDTAKAGYTRGYADPEYIRELPGFQLPFLSRNRKYRSFQISGDSMFPIPDGAWVTGEFVENWLALKDGVAAIILTKNEGLVFKLLENHLNDKKELVLHSLNNHYQPYKIAADEIMEIWKFVNYISPEIPDALPQDIEISHAIANLRQDVDELKKMMR